MDEFEREARRCIQIVKKREPMLRGVKFVLNCKYEGRAIGRLHIHEKPLVYRKTYYAGSSITSYWGLEDAYCNGKNIY